MALLEALLALARGVIVAAGIAGLAPNLREQLVPAIEGLRTQHGLAYEEVALQVGLCARTLRRWRSELVTVRPTHLPFCAAVVDPLVHESGRAWGSARQGPGGSDGKHEQTA